MAYIKTGVGLAFGLACLAAPLTGALSQDKAWYPFKVESWDPPFNMESPRKEMDYSPLEKAAQKWDICVSFPHMKDAYWLAVDYGVAEEAKRQGVKMTLVEAGGYTNLNKQISQIEDCVAGGAQAVIIGAISYDGLNNLVKEVTSKGIPVIDVINGMSSPDLTAKSLVSFGEMGFKAGEYIAKQHPKGSGKVKVAWFPGPPGAGWVEAGNKGFLDAQDEHRARGHLREDLLLVGALAGEEVGLVGPGPVAVAGVRGVGEGDDGGDVARRGAAEFGVQLELDHCGWRVMYGHPC